MPTLVHILLRNFSLSLVDILRVRNDVEGASATLHLDYVVRRGTTDVYSRCHAGVLSLFLGTRRAYTLDILSSEMSGVTDPPHIEPSSLSLYLSQS